MYVFRPKSCWFWGGLDGSLIRWFRVDGVAVFCLVSVYVKVEMQYIVWMSVIRGLFYASAVKTIAALSRLSVNYRDLTK